MFANKNHLRLGCLNHNTALMHQDNDKNGKQAKTLQVGNNQHISR